MNILVTVGTTRFDSLVEYIDSHFKNSIFSITFQIADGKYKPKNFPYFDYSENIDLYYNQSDFVVTHAGAGSIYKLLEKHKKIIIVPNLDRRDNHQLDIANFMSTNNYAISVADFDHLNKAFESIQGCEFSPFEKVDFNKTLEIINYCLPE